MRSSVSRFDPAEPIAPLKIVGDNIGEIRTDIVQEIHKIRGKD